MPPFYSLLYISTNRGGILTVISNKIFHKQSFIKSGTVKNKAHIIFYSDRWRNHDEGNA